MIENKKLALEQLELQAKLSCENIDITLPSHQINLGSMHSLSIVLKDIEELFLGMGYSIANGPEVESDHYNFELMNLPKYHPARDMQDIFYNDENTLMRMHTSPIQARVMQAAKGVEIDYSIFE